LGSVAEMSPKAGSTNTTVMALRNVFDASFPGLPTSRIPVFHDRSPMQTCPYNSKELRRGVDHLRAASVRTPRRPDKTRGNKHMPLPDFVQSDNLDMFDDYMARGE